ncbi:hypothetical protein ACLB1M_16275 [Escherichia coli]
MTVELRDENDKPVKEQKQQLNNAVSIDNVKANLVSLQLERNRRWRL